MAKNIEDCQTPNELAEAIEYHLNQGGMRLDIINGWTGTDITKIDHDDHETHRLYGIALSQYNKIRKSYPKLPPPQIHTADPLSGLAQIQQLCSGSSDKVNSSNITPRGIWHKIRAWSWKLYEKTLRVVVDAVLEKLLPKS